MKTKTDESTPFNLAEITIQYSCRVKPADRTKIRSSRDADQVLRAVIPSFEHREYFYLLCLNRSNQLLGYHQVSVGGISGTTADVRIIFQIALKANASAILIAHNHPSGNLQASESDQNLTRKIKNAGNLLDITLLDHLILTQDAYLSFADEGLM
ncbi:MAG: JAB domain-containing protein [Candidatus Cloacimonetes bacterium]|jgi:DNA repair protein RadC|nr:JAB domain-containing protein [Candidatus Cloacimonadota bacterium]MDD4454306.1 JAB domain-containing protein [Candidatus Methanomethylophilaceae archaeon]